MKPKPPSRLSPERKKLWLAAAAVFCKNHCGRTFAFGYPVFCNPKQGQVGEVVRGGDRISE